MQCEHFQGTWDGVCPDCGQVINKNKYKKAHKVSRNSMLYMDRELKPLRKYLKRIW